MNRPLAATKASDRANRASRRPGSRPAKPLLLEIAWEVCNQVGGIYTVLRSKVPAMIERWGNRYCLLGPYNANTAEVEFEPAPMAGPFGETAQQLIDQGIEVHYGRWLVSGRPQVILVNHSSMLPRLPEIKYRFWTDHAIELPSDAEMLNDVVAFGEAAKELLWLLSRNESAARIIVAHFHEWMAGAAIPMLRHGHWPGSIVFTTHATSLGRYLAMNHDQFYEQLPHFDPLSEARKYQVEAQYRLERAAVHGAQVFTTVSDVTGEECRHLLGRKPDLLVPNGLNIRRFSAVHEFHNLHRQFKDKIHAFTIGHFFPSYCFDLDKTLYFFTSGRFEYRNKGMDLTIEALARLNHRLRQTDCDLTVVAFIITRRPTRSIDITALQSRAMLEEFRTSVDEIKKQVGEKLFLAAAEGQTPNLDSLVEDYWRLRLRRAIQTWKRKMPPGIVTHMLEDDQNDAVLNQLRACRLWNQQEDPVKVVYHPDFIKPSNPLLGMEYEQFVRGCHLGIFPSYYEPWGYTPLESMALSVPAITSDLSGFGSYLQQLLPNHEQKGLYVLNRQHISFHDAADALTEYMFKFCQMNRRERMALRNEVESFSVHFDWSNLGKRYHEAHELAMDRIAALEMNKAR